MILDTDDEWGDDTVSELPGYKFYDGSVTLHFDPGPHVYFRYDEEGNRVNVDGVTTVLDVINKPFLKSWAAKVAIEFVKDAMLLPDGGFKQFSTEEFMAMLHEAKGQHKVHLDKAGNIGHIAHNIMEDSIKFAIEHTDGIILELKKLPTEDTPANGMAVNCANHAFEWAKRHNVRWIATERKVYSKEFDVAGTMDGLCIVDSCDDLKCCRGRVFHDRKAIADFKSSNQLADSYAYQVAIYLFCQTEEFGEYIPDRWVLRLGKTEGDFEPWYLPADYFAQDLEAFLSALKLHRSLKEITERRQNDARELRAIIKAIKDEQKAIKEASEKAERAQAKAARMEATRLRNEAKDLLYKKLRAEGRTVVEAKDHVAREYPTPLRNFRDLINELPVERRQKINEQAQEIISAHVTNQETDPDVEWSINL